MFLNLVTCEFYVHPIVCYLGTKEVKWHLMIEVPAPDPSEIKRRFDLANEGRDFTVYDWRMDVALEAKLRSVVPYFGEVPDGARIVDAGSGTGLMAEAIAREFRGANVYALDFSHELAERATENQSLTQLVYGDASEQVFPDDSVDIKFYSTSGHEIESFGGAGRMTDAVEATFRELKPGGRIIVRDFAKPTDTTPINMRLLTQVGEDDVEKATHDGIIDYNKLSPRALFLRFHEEFGGGNAFNYHFFKRNGHEYINILPEWAHEFYMRKDYTGNWRQEIHEKYTYWTQEQARKVLEDAGFIDIQVIPDPNEFILKNRLEGKVELSKEDEDGNFIPLPFPTTHMVVVGVKPEARKLITDPEISSVNYEEIKSSINFDEERRVVKIGDQEFKISPSHEVAFGSKKMVFVLEEGEKVLKVVRKDGKNDHNIFKAMQQSIERENLLDENGVPHAKILEIDPGGPPYRYFVQEQIPEGSLSAAQLIKDGLLSEVDVEQMAKYINTFELGKRWQLDTNPFNWYRVQKENGTTEMVYIDGKVYPYDEKWEFKKVGLLQWLDPKYVSGLYNRSASIPKISEYEEMAKNWQVESNPVLGWWRKNLSAILQP